MGGQEWPPVDREGDMKVENHPVIKRLEKQLATPYGDLLRLNPNEACEIVYSQLVGDPEWVKNSTEYAQYIYRRLWVDAKSERSYSKRYTYGRVL